jgi:hypothetical protein
MLATSVELLTYNNPDKIRHRVALRTIWYGVLAVALVIGNLLMHWGIGNVSSV